MDNKLYGGLNMKKIITTLGTLFLTTIIFAQTGLDTVFVRNPQLKMEEWWWGIKGINPDGLDSLQSKQYNKLINALKDANLSSAQLFTYDSLPGPFAMVFFVDYWNRSEARSNMGQGIDTKLRAYTPLAPYIANIDAQLLARFNQRKTGGKNRTN